MDSHFLSLGATIREALILPHNIDLMHQERNVAESIISMCFDFTGLTKDNMNARKDLANLCDRPQHEVRLNASDNESRPRAPYVGYVP